MFISEEISEQTVVCLFSGIQFSDTKEQRAETHTTDECCEHAACAGVTQAGQNTLWYDYRQNKPVVGKVRTVFAYREGRNGLGRSMREFSGGDGNILFFFFFGNILFLKGVKVIHLYLFVKIL